MVMMRTGERIARTANIRLSCTAAVLDDDKVLLARRAEDDRWCFPGGGVDPGESVKEACEREVLEETGLIVEATRLIAVTSDPNRVFEYSDGNRWHTIDLFFAAAILSGTINPGNEITDVRFFSRAEISDINLLLCHRELIDDVFSNRIDTLVL